MGEDESPSPRMFTTIASVIDQSGFLDLLDSYPFRRLLDTGRLHKATF
jgi:hypothetical protein